MGGDSPSLASWLCVVYIPKAKGDGGVLEVFSDNLSPPLDSANRCR